jgi:hypothetical protein
MMATRTMSMTAVTDMCGHAVRTCFTCGPFSRIDPTAPIQNQL